MTKRRLELDYVKGFAILAMLFSHCMTGENIILSWITHFHMAVFFITSGVLKASKESTKTTLRDIGNYLKKRSFQLLLPYFIFGLLLIAFYQTLAVIGGESLTLVNQLKDLFTFYGIESLWFIPVFFFAEFIFNFAYIKLQKCIRGGSLVIIVLGVALFLHCFATVDFKLVRVLVKIIIAVSFIYIGYIIGKYDLVEKCNICISILLLIIGSVLTYFNGSVGISALDLGNVVLFYINATFISFGLLSVFKKISEKNLRPFKILEFFGKNTIVVLCTNNLLVEILRLADSKLTGGILLEWGIIGSVILAIIITLIEALIIYIAKSKIGIIFGQKR